jgi:hypothetical protein
LQALPVASESDGDRITVLKSLLDAARVILRDLRDDPLFERLVNLYVCMPEGDRAIVIGALEREVQTRLLADQVADTLTQVDLRPNPKARIYLRVVEPEDKSEEVEKLAFLRAIYNIQRGISTLDPHWREMIVQGLRQMDPAARAQLEAFNRMVQQALEEAASAAEPVQARAAVPPAVEETAPEPDVPVRREN